MRLATTRMNQLWNKLDLTEEQKNFAKALRRTAEFLLTLEPFLEYDELSCTEIALMQDLETNQVAKLLTIARKKGLIIKTRLEAHKQYKRWYYTAKTLNGGSP